MMSMKPNEFQIMTLAGGAITTVSIFDSNSLRHFFERHYFLRDTTVLFLSSQNWLRYYIYGKPWKPTEGYSSIRIFVFVHVIGSLKYLIAIIILVLIE